MVGLVDSDLHRVGAALSSLFKRGLHQCTAKSASTAGGGDIQLGEIALETLAPDRLPKAKNREPVGTIAGEQDDRVTPEEIGDALCQLLNRWCGLVELAVEVVQ